MLAGQARARNLLPSIPSHCIGEHIIIRHAQPFHTMFHTRPNFSLFLTTAACIWTAQIVCKEVYQLWGALYHQSSFSNILWSCSTLMRMSHRGCPWLSNLLV